LTGGGSGGHITPLLSLAREIKSLQPDCQIIYVGHKGDDFDSLKTRADNFDFLAFINAGKFRRYHGEGVAALFDLKTLGLNIRDFFRLPASIISEYYAYPKNTIEYVGIPIDERIKKVTPKIMAECRRKLGLPASGSVLLLSGGGNGSVRLNQLLLAVAKNLLEADLSLHILHITGRAHQQSVSQAYKEKLPKTELGRVIVEGFTPDFYVHSAAADLVVTRAGATTLAELAAEGKACVIIPSPFLTGGHQLKNARQLADIGAAVVANESIEPDEFLVLVNELLGNDHRRFELAKNLYATAKPDAAAELAEIIIKNAKK
jgi:UDP-N-acetylglucosamine--N-acetylmuramyl-(pentapeptide) pyrophosphoryl-undecaprenol N-acetylglucosamine transferase